jgi:hypothetical protein
MKAGKANGINESYLSMAAWHRQYRQRIAARMAAMDGEDSMAAAASHGEKWRTAKSAASAATGGEIAATRRKKAANISGQRSACGANQRRLAKA